MVCPGVILVNEPSPSPASFFDELLGSNDDEF
jgi:hypothetical protein